MMEKLNRIPGPKKKKKISVLAKAFDGYKPNNNHR